MQHASNPEQGEQESESIFQVGKPSIFISWSLLNIQSLGRKSTLLTIGPAKRQFLIHEDLLCNRSPYFRSFLQTTRKGIDGDCSVCLEDLNTGRECLSHCTKCGGNFHSECIDEWLKQRTSKPRCPLCRHTWVSLKRKASEYVFRDLPEDVFAKYHEWIYRGTMGCAEVVEKEDFKPLVSAYLFALKIQDLKFGTAVLQAMLELYKEFELYPDQDAVAMAYNTDETPEKLAGLHKLQTFMIDTYLTAADPSWFEDEDWDGYPREFLRDLIVAMLLQHPRKNKWSLDTWKAKLEADE